MKTIYPSFFRNVLLCVAISLAALTSSAPAEAEPPKIGIVIMHGKGGSPAKFVARLAGELEQRGFLVANIEMPWSGRRDYDVSVATAESEVETALAGLRERGAAKVFVSGHSQGGLFALYFGGKHTVDGIVAIAPGGSVTSRGFREKLGESVAEARRLVAEGKGAEKARLLDFEGTRGVYPVVVAPSLYLNWFDPEGAALDHAKAPRNINPNIPVLLIVPTRDYAPLVANKQATFNALPKHPLTRLYEPDSSHTEAPTASIQEIVDWTTAVANAR